MYSKFLIFKIFRQPKVESVVWKPTQSNSLTYLNLDDEITIQNVKQFSPRQFWTSLGFAENENLDRY